MTTNCNYIKRIKCSWSTLGIHLLCGRGHVFKFLTISSQPPHIIINGYQKHLANGTTVIPYDDVAFMLTNVYNVLGKGKRAAIVCHSRTRANEIYLGLQARFPSKVVKIYTGETDSATKKADFEDVDVTWKDVDVVIYNSTCESGISCTISEFEDVFAFFSNHIVCVQASYQMIGRIRAIKRLHLYTPPDSSDDTYSLPITREDVLEQYCHSHEPLPGNLLSILKAGEDGWGINDSPFFEVLYTNISHRNSSRMAFGALFLELCKSSGMTILPRVETVAKPDRELESVVDDLMIDASECRATEIADAPIITREQAEAWKYSNTLGREEHDSLSKYHLGDLYNRKPDKIDREFVYTYNNAHMKKTFKAQCALREAGSNALNAVRMMESIVPGKDAWFTAETLRTHKASSSVDVNAIQRSWHEISKTEWRGHKAVNDLIFVVTGRPGLKVVDNCEGVELEVEEIYGRLGREVEYGPKGGVKRGGKYIKQDVVDVLQKIRSELNAHCPGVRIREFKDNLGFTRVFTTLNGVLRSMYGCSFTRKDRKNPESPYVLMQSKYFTDNDKDENLAVLSPWRHSKRYIKERQEKRVKEMEVAREKAAKVEREKAGQVERERVAQVERERVAQVDREWQDMCKEHEEINAAVGPRLDSYYGY
jgi:hypothetical protein